MPALREHVWLLVTIVAWVCFQAYPDLMRNSIDPYDGALFAANGALFLSAVREFGQFLASPIDWLYDYFNQYPALAVRRHPPLFGITEMLVYLFTGVSVFGAKLTALFYSIAFAIGVYALSYRIWKDAFIAAATAFLVMSTPQIIWLSTAIRLDLPALAFAVWAIFHYVGYINTHRRSSAVYFAILAVLSLYTYQLTLFIIASACLHLIAIKRLSAFRDRTVWLLSSILLICLVPLAVMQLYVAMDNITAAAGGTVQEWTRFHPVSDRLSLEYFLYYPKVWLKEYPVQSAGFLVWLYLAMRRGVTREEALLLLCAATAFAFISWMRGKEPRYAVYTMIPIAFLAARAIGELLAGWLKTAALSGRGKLAAGAITLLGLGQAYYIGIGGQNWQVSGMGRPVHDIIANVRNPKILYSGPRDAAFVFYLRQMDDKRSARVYRATVQLKSPEALSEYVRKAGINIIAVEEGDVRSGEDGFAEFRDEIHKLIEAGGGTSFNTYSIEFKKKTAEKEVRLQVFMLGDR